MRDWEIHGTNMMGEILKVRGKGKLGYKCCGNCRLGLPWHSLKNPSEVQLLVEARPCCFECQSVCILDYVGCWLFMWFTKEIKCTNQERGYDQGFAHGLYIFDSGTWIIDTTTTRRFWQDKMQSKKKKKEWVAETLNIDRGFPRWCQFGTIAPLNCLTMTNSFP